MNKGTLGLEPTSLCLDCNALTIKLELIEFKQIFVEHFGLKLSNLDPLELLKSDVSPN